MRAKISPAFVQVMTDLHAVSPAHGDTPSTSLLTVRSVMELIGTNAPEGDLTNEFRLAFHRYAGIVGYPRTEADLAQEPFVPSGREWDAATSR